MEGNFFQKDSSPGEGDDFPWKKAPLSACHINTLQEEQQGTYSLTHTLRGEGTIGTFFLGVFLKGGQVPFQQKRKKKIIRSFLHQKSCEGKMNSPTFPEKGVLGGIENVEAPLGGH